MRPALEWDHPGAHDSKGVSALQQHVGDLSRNVVVASERAAGTRGHMMFLARADVDLRYVEVRDMGRTMTGAIDSTTFNDEGRALRSARTRSAVTRSTSTTLSVRRHAPADGYQFTLIGNAVDDASKWGITIHNTHYGLVRDNVVYNSRGAAIVAEDGTESFNVFEHNFAMRSEGSGEFAPRSGYGGATDDPGGEGAGFWLRGPNNILRNNVAANVDVFGFSLAGSVGSVRIPTAAGADTRSAARRDRSIARRLPCSSSRITRRTRACKSEWIAAGTASVSEFHR